MPIIGQTECVFPLQKNRFRALCKTLPATKPCSAIQAKQQQIMQTVILNSDKVFWQRRTDDLLLNAKMQATSGDPSHLNKFKLFDSNDIKNNPGLPLSSVWVADSGDEQKIVAAMLPAARKICCVALYENPDPASHIVNAELMIGRHSFQTGELKENGAATIFEFPPTETNMIAVKLKAARAHAHF